MGYDRLPVPLPHERNTRGAGGGAGGIYSRCQHIIRQEKRVFVATFREYRG